MTLATAAGLALVPGTSMAQGDDAVVAAAAAEQAVRNVLVDLSLPEAPTPSDFEIAARALEMIAELAPDDAELARLQTAAAFGTGDPALLAEATARVVRIDPADTVAQLRLITARIADRQTVEGRIEVYDRLLGPRGVSIHPSVRSRLALDAALIHREQGNLDAFVRTLTQAIDLDPTNKEAQHLATGYYADYAGDDTAGRVGLLEMQLGLMWSDPIDPNVHISIARLLAVEGATREALRFYNNGTSILGRAGLLEPRHQSELLALQWLNDGPRSVLDQIDQTLRLQRDAARIRYKEDLQRDVPDRLLMPPEEVFLDPLYEKIRVIAAMDARDGEALRAGLAEIDAYARYQFKEKEEATRLDDPESRERALNELANSLVSLQFMRALANVELNQLAAQVPQLIELIGEEKWERIRKPLTAWVALRAGDLERTRQLLREIGVTSPEMLILYAELLVAEGKSTEAARLYDQILRSERFVPYGAWARSRAMELTGRTDPVTEAGRRMRQLAAEVPLALDTITRDPAAAISLNLEPVNRSFDEGERVALRLRLTNTTPWPLSLGPNRTISSRFLLAPAVDDADMLLSPPQPVVIDMDRRLRLESGETISIDIAAERGLNGWIFDSAARGVLRQLWQVWQSPTIGRSGGYDSGPYSLSDSTSKFTRSVRQQARLPVADVADFVLNAAGPEDTVAAVESAAARVLRGEAEGEDVAPIVDALVTRYGTAGPLERALMLAALPATAQAGSMRPFDEAVLRDVALEAVRQVETPRLVAALVLLTRVTDAGAPLLTAAADGQDPVLSRFAVLLRARLEQGRASIATAGPGLDALSGASKAAALRGPGEP